MATVPSRLIRRVRADFGPGADRVLALLGTVPESVPGCTQDPERMQAALVLPAGGDESRLAGMVDLARTDWRDALVAGGLADGDWPSRLDAELGRR